MSEPVGLNLTNNFKKNLTENRDASRHASVDEKENKKQLDEMIGGLRKALSVDERSHD